MKLKDGMMLYHGSYTPVQNIDLTKCAVGKDFGKGFYVTADELQAKNFIRTSLLKAKRSKHIDDSQNIEKKKFCADLILTDAIMDMAEEDGITWQEARSKIINSNAYTALYDLETGLWGNGPDYFRDFYKKTA